MTQTQSFRSILPHEPIPNEDHGYLHIQGAFCPRRRRKGSDTNEEALDITIQSFWTVHTLENALSQVFREKYAALGLPFAATHVEVLDNAAPFTKARLVFETPLQAFHVFVAIRQRKTTISSLFSSINHPEVFAARPVQATLITQQQLLPETVAWIRSNPPKFRRLVLRPGECETALQEERETTRFVFISNLLENENVYPEFWDEPNCVAQAIRSTFPDVEVFVNHKKLTKYCHLGFRSAEDAQRAIASYQEKRVQWNWTDEKGTNHCVPSGVLFLDYAAITHRSRRRLVRGEGPGEPSRSECTSLTAHVHVPGLVLIPDFVSPEEEAALLAVLDGPHAPWAPAQHTPTDGGIVKRSVQHYGYVFDYRTADVLRDRNTAGSDCPPMPAVNLDDKSLKEFIEDNVREGCGWEVLAGVVEKVRREKFSEQDNRCYSTINQLTVNRYAPGEGIGSHVDTPSAFGDGLISISLGSGIVMEFNNVQEKGIRKQVFLPPRSLLLMSQEARYTWEHMIVSRMTDTYEGEVIRRGTRLSLTLRTALDTNGTPMPNVESHSFPPCWGNPTLSSPLATPDCERNHVHAVYDAIATQWHHTRGKRGVLWPGATQFLQQLPRGSVVADVGCGDGKYFPAIWEAGSYVIGTDISLPLLKTATSAASLSDEGVPESRRVSKSRHHLRNRPAIAVADCMSVPLRTDSCDAAICIAVMHHLSNESRRRRCVEELVRIVKPGGLINIQAWAMTQEEGSRRRFASNDVYVPFNAQPRHLTLNNNTSTSEAESSPDQEESSLVQNVSSTAKVFSKALNADYDEQKGLIVFKRYCHLYRQGELDSIAATISNVEMIESGFESGNFFIILRKTG